MIKTILMCLTFLSLLACTNTDRYEITLNLGNDKNEICDLASNFAENVIQARYDGLDQEELLTYFDEHSHEINTELAYQARDLNKRFVNEAFKLPKEATDQEKNISIQQFKEAKFKECMERI